MSRSPYLREIQRRLSEFWPNVMATHQCRHSTVSPYWPKFTWPYRRSPSAMAEPLHGGGPWHLALLLLLY